eukprot:TRINITY_DN2808_c0_g1_i4.p1 TRINITY_DN2808_c0_g1~~TRINITY_DN2808_c0_g1_i4.p1  ORF type:complete len:108 (+),score=10.71 TRINITY_DN2808_c0_g1_i4:94-417(+)
MYRHSLAVQVEFTGLESTPLFCAAWNGSKEMVKLLLEYRSDPKRGEPCAIHSAAMSGDIEILKMLVKHPEDVVVKVRNSPLRIHPPFSRPRLMTRTPRKKSFNQKPS